MTIYDSLIAKAIGGSGGGGGGGFPTATVTITAEKNYCDAAFQSDIDGGEYTALALFDNNSEYKTYYHWDSDALTQGVSLNFLMLADTFYITPYYDGDNPNGITITGDATWDSDNYMVAVSGDCSIHLVGFDE